MADERTTDVQAEQYTSPPPQHPNMLILALIFPTMVALLQLKYQGSNKSPFETHFADMFLSIASLLLYCFSLNAMPLKTSPDSNYTKMVRFLASVFGPLTLASYLSLLYPSLRPTLYAISILYSAMKFLYSTFTQRLNWLYHKFANSKRLKWLYQKFVNSTDTDSSDNQIPA